MRRISAVWAMPFVLLCVSFFIVPARAAEIRVAAWNVHEGFTPESIHARQEVLKKLGDELRPDVLVLEEVVTPAVATAVRDAMGLAGYYVACSNFNPSDEPDFTALEVAVLSRYPFAQVVEYDPTPDNDLSDGDPDESPITADYKLGIPVPNDVRGTRGFLWVRIPELRLTVSAVHLKSSRGVDGDADRENALRREFVTAAIMRSVAGDALTFPDHTAVIAGDFNVGHSDPKNGRDLRRDDTTTSESTDGYDETHALLTGLAGIRMTNLMRHISETTFPSFPSTPIDNIYVGGPNAAKFSPAEMFDDTFGSDHRPLVTTLSLDTTPAQPTPAPTDYLVPTLAPRPAKPASSPASELPAPVAIPLADVAQSVGKNAIVEFTVVGGNKLERMAFLNSQADFRAAGTFTVVINTRGLEKFAAAGISDPPAHFRGRKVRATGVIAQRGETYQVIASDPDQIELVP
ncbi:MAG: endonuclease/exonuclease/phosphatase family protein [Planctomycetes bacterium]|nr:endonuclease/exonuclease/phosphatase family protein [Planctomycetota bacterium]